MTRAANRNYSITFFDLFLESRKHHQNASFFINRHGIRMTFLTEDTILTDGTGI